MKIIRKILFVMLLMTIILNLFNFSNKVQAYTSTELKEKLDYVHWNSDFIDRNSWRFIENYDKYLGASCHGYANAVSLALFNSNQNANFNDWVFTENVEELCVGDLIRYRNDYYAGSTNHTMVVIDIVGDTVYITDANYDGNNGIRWGIAYSKSELSSMISKSLSWTDFGWNKGYFRHYIYNDVKTVSDTENPVVTSAYVDPTSMTGSSYTVKVFATDNVGISKIPIMTWSVDNGQDDIKEYRATSDGSGYSYTVKASNHGNNKGLYYSHVYVYDEVGNGVAVKLNNIPMNTKFVKNLGSFEARIVLKSNQDYVITANGTSQNANVMLGKKSVSDESQIWKFNQQSDGSYEIVNVASNRALDITDAEDKDGANVAIHTRNNSNAQTFYIMEYNGGYRIVPKCTSNLKAIDLADNKVEAGHNIDLYNAYSVDNAAQTWTFEKCAESIKLDKTTMSFVGTGSTQKLTATITPSTVANKTLTWSSSNTSVARVSSTGVVTPVGIGTATITVKTTDGTNKSATCKVTVNEAFYTDVKTTDWYYSAVKYCKDKGIILGTTETTYNPNTKLTRGMLVTILHRMEGKPEPKTQNKFKDVYKALYYYDAVVWATEKGIVHGYGDGSTFGPDDAITREDLAVILRNYAQYKGKNVNVATDLGANFSDGTKVSTHAKTAMQWAVGTGVITGNDTTSGKKTLTPQGTATRAEVASMIYKYCTKVK